MISSDFGRFRSVFNFNLKELPTILVSISYFIYDFLIPFEKFIIVLFYVVELASYLKALNRKKEIILFVSFPFIFYDQTYVTQLKLFHGFSKNSFPIQPQ